VGEDTDNSGVIREVSYNGRAFLDVYPENIKIHQFADGGYAGDIEAFTRSGWPKDEHGAHPTDHRPYQPTDYRPRIEALPAYVTITYRWPQWWIDAVARAQEQYDALADEYERVAEQFPSGLTDHEADAWWQEQEEKHNWFKRSAEIEKELIDTADEKEGT
jgi:hypothetical protein